MFCVLQIEKLEKSIEEKSAAIQTKTQCLRSAKHKLTLNTTSLMTDILGLEVSYISGKEKETRLYLCGAHTVMTLYHSIIIQAVQYWCMFLNGKESVNLLWST